MLDLGNFEHTTAKNNEMDLHLLVQEHGKSELLLHPIFQVFLDLKWNQVKKFYLFNLLLDIIFLILLACSAYYFLDLIYCQPCDEEIFTDFGDKWSMKINDGTLDGTLDCFSPLGLCKQDDKNCKNKFNCIDAEKCAKFTKSTTKEPIYLNNTMHTLGFKCHKNFLR